MFYRFPDIIVPQKLRPGDRIGVISPASPPLGEKQAYLQNGVRYLTDCGYLVVTGNYIEGNYGYLAGSDEERLSDLNKMITDPDIAAIFFTRGGYGTPRLLAQIDYQRIRGNPKVIVGYSDLTALQLALFAQAGLVSFSGPMVAVEMGKGIHRFTERELWRMITQSKPAELAMSTPYNHLSVIKKGKAKGRLLGGCLSVLTALIGTDYLPDLTDAILFLEEIGEPVYKVDRCFSQLSHAGILSSISGLILGDFLDCEPENQESPLLSVTDVIQHYIRDVNIPVVGNFPYGHGAVKYTLPVGCRVQLDTEKKTIKMLESGVR